jgi:hypothetical protein
VGGGVNQGGVALAFDLSQSGEQSVVKDALDLADAWLGGSGRAIERVPTARLGAVAEGVERIPLVVRQAAHDASLGRTTEATAVCATRRVSSGCGVIGWPRSRAGR